MAMVALRLRRHRLLADPTRFLSIRIEPIRSTAVAAAATSFPSQRPTHFGSSIHPHRTPSPCSPSAAPINCHRPPTPCSTHPSTRTAPPLLVPYISSPPSSVTLRRFSPPRSTFSPASIGNRCHSAEEQCNVGLLAAVEAGPRALPRWRKASPSMGTQAARRILSAANPRLPQASSSRSLLVSGPKRFFSSVPGSSEDQPRLPPVNQLVFREDPQVIQEEWVDPIPHLREHSLVVDSRTNHLNLEIPGFKDQLRCNFSEDTGIPLFQSLVFLALVNNNRGYCVKKSFRKDNLLLCPKLKQFRFKKVDHDDLNPDSKDFNRAASYYAAAKLIRELLQDTVGPHAISCLLEESRDLLSKMEQPSDERLIAYHASFLSTEGRIWFYLKLYRFYFKVIPFSKEDAGLKKSAWEALGDMAYTSPLEQCVEKIIQGHSLLAHIDSKKPTRDTEVEAMLENFSCPTAGKYAEHKAKESMRLGKMIVAIHRHTVEHAFEKEARQVKSKPSPEAKPKRFWRYSLDQVVDLLRTCFPVYLLKVQETFVKSELWDQIEIDSYWARDLTWMGGVPKPTDAERAAIKPSYGQRRQKARKFDKFNTGTSADTNNGAGSKRDPN